MQRVWEESHKDSELGQSYHLNSQRFEKHSELKEKLK